MIIAIDGPAASGKSTTARMVASKLGIIHIDTGAMYRAVALHFILNNINIKNVNQVTRELELISIKFGQEFNTIFLNDVDVTSQIRNSKVNALVSKVSAIQSVRKKMVFQQRKIAKNKSVVIEGRDIGTRVFPDAEFKFFLTADIYVRAQRRLNENSNFGKKLNLEQVIEELTNRDEFDKQRKYSPLKIPRDAIIIDTSNLSFEEQVQKIINQITKI